MPLPDEISEETAAAVMMQGLTAHILITDTHPATAGETILVHAAAGGVGLLLVQLAKGSGASVIATVSTAATEKLAYEAGVDHVIRYTEVDVPDRVRELTDGQRVTVATTVSARQPSTPASPACADGGCSPLYGAASGPVPPVDPMGLHAGSLSLTRPNLLDHVATRDELLERLSDLFGAIATGRLTVRISGRYALSQARTAYEDL